jgi:hypothetical protein
MAVNTRNSIVTNGLVLALDAGNTKSLPEAPSTNLMVQSQDFTSVNWAKVRSSVTASVATAPNGTVTGTRLVNDTSNNTHYVRSDGYTFTAGETYTISYYAKSAELSWIGLQINEANVIFPTTYTNLASGSLGSVGSGTTATIQAVGNGWHRTSITRTVVNPGLSYFAIITSTGDNVQSYAGDGTSGTYIWGVQLEKLPYATSYIPTTTTSVSRNTWFDISGNRNNGSLLNGPTFSSQNGGSIAFDGVDDYGALSSNLVLNGPFTWIINCRSNTLSAAENRQTYLAGSNNWFEQSDNDTLFVVNTNEVSFNLELPFGLLPQNTWYNIAVTRKVDNTFDFYYNGIKQTLRSGDTTPVSGSYNISRLGAIVGGGRYWNGNIAQILIYNKALSSTEVLQNYNATKTRFGL